MRLALPNIIDHLHLFTEATCDVIALNSNETSLTVRYGPQAINGRFKPSLNGRFSVNTSAKYSCDDHHGIVHKLVGESTSVCQENGEWTKIFPEPVCGICFSIYIFLVIF